MFGNTDVGGVGGGERRLVCECIAVGVGALSVSVPAETDPPTQRNQMERKGRARDVKETSVTVVLDKTKRDREKNKILLASHLVAIND